MRLAGHRSDVDDRRTHTGTTYGCVQFLMKPDSTDGESEEPKAAIHTLDTFMQS